MLPLGAWLLLASLAFPVAAETLPPMPLPRSGAPLPAPLPDADWFAVAQTWIRAPHLSRPLDHGAAICAGDESAALAIALAGLGDDPPAARAERLRVLAVLPTDPRVAVRAAGWLGAWQLRAGAPREAATALTRFLEQIAPPPTWTAWLWLALAHEREGDRAAARAALREGLDRAARTTARATADEAAAERLALTWAGWLALADDEISDARRLWRQALVGAAGEPGAATRLRLNLAETYFGSGEWDSVRVLLAPVAVGEGVEAAQAVRIAFLRGRAAFERGALEAAVGELAQVQAPAAPQAWVDEALLLRAWIALRQGATEEARRCYAAVSGERVEDIPTARYGAALAHLREAAVREALALLAPEPPVGRNDPLYAPWVYALAYAQFQTGEPAATLATLDLLRGDTLADSLAGAAWVLRGDAHYRVQEMEAAAAAYARAATVEAEPPESLLRRQALAAIGAERWGAATRRLGELLLKFPGTPRAAEYNFWRGECFYRLGRLASARTHYRRAARLGADPAQAAYALGWCDYREGLYTEALAHFDQAARVGQGSPFAPDLAVRRANCLFNLGQIAPAAEGFAAAARLAAARDDPTLAEEARFREAWALLRLGRFAAAAVRFASLHADAGERPIGLQALFWDGQARFRSGDYDAAIERFTRLRAATATPETLRARGLLAGGDAHFNAGEMAGAIEWYRLALEAPAATRAIRRSAHTSLFECRQLRGEWEQARLTLEELARRFPEAVTGGERHYQLAEGLFQSRRHQEALEAYADFLERADPEDQRLAMVRYRMALCRERLGEHATAAAAFTALGAEPGFRRRAAALLRGGRLYLELEEPRRALVAFEQRLGLDLTPGEAALTRAYLAQAYEALDEAAAARGEWEKVAHAGAVVSDSLRAIAHLQLGRGAFEVGQWEAAQGAFAAAESLGLAARIYRPRYWAGEAAWRAGDPSSAAEWLEAFLAGGETDPLWRGTALVRLAECDEALGRWSAARECYEAVLALPLEGAGLRQEAEERLGSLPARRAEGER